jgi:hypothetical protein
MCVLCDAIKQDIGERLFVVPFNVLQSLIHAAGVKPAFGDDDLTASHSG